MQNERVTRLRRISATALTVSAALLVAGCSSGEESPDGATGSSAASESPAGSEQSEAGGAPTPTAFDLPEGVTLTDPGSELSFGESATVAVEPQRARGSALTLTVDSVQQGRTSDLNAYVLNARAKKATPYYVDVTVANDGPGDLGGYTVPLYGQFDDAILENTTFATPFKRCASDALPRRFGAGKSVQRCLVFLVPDGGDLAGVAFARAGFDPIAWSGSVTPPKEQKSSKKKSGGGGNG